MKLLDGRVAIITGSTRGNGRAIANLFSEHGANVVITGREQNEVQEVVDEILREYKTNPLGLKVDITSIDEVRELVAKTLQKYKQIDVLVNNAGYPIKNELWDVRFDEITDEGLEKVLDVDTNGTYRCSREVIPFMVKQKHGVIIVISSTPAIGGYKKGAPYTVAKAANLGITKHIAAEYGRYNIRCNAIAPGSIATPRNWDRLTVEEKRETVSSIPLGRAGKPEEVAGVALMLASDYSSFVNGQTVIVDGGETIR
jgi:NAD(P)-dependent dehydrogenase (short-subunit alcohol dehydrogenase family)